MQMCNETDCKHKNHNHETRERDLKIIRATVATVLMDHYLTFLNDPRALQVNMINTANCSTRCTDPKCERSGYIERMMGEVLAHVDGDEALPVREPLEMIINEMVARSQAMIPVLESLGIDVEKATEGLTFVDLSEMGDEGVEEFRMESEPESTVVDEGQGKTLREILQELDPTYKPEQVH
jgi:hypothetical protein